MHLLFQIDPEEHKVVIEQVEQLKKEVSTLKAQKSSAEDETASAKSTMVKLNTDISLQKSLVEKQNAMFVKLKADKDSSAKTSSALLELTKERNQLKEKIVKMDFDAKSTITELNGANQRNEMLKNRMRQFQVTLNKQTKRIEELEIQLAKVTSQIVTETTDHVAHAEKENSKEVEKEPIKLEPKVMVSPSEETKAPILEMKGKPPVAPEGGFKFGPGGKSLLLEKKNVEALLLLPMEAPVRITSEGTRNVSTQGLSPIEVQNQEKLDVDKCPQQEYSGVLQSITDIGPTPKLSTLRPHSPIREKVETQSEGNDFEATKKKALIAKLNEKKRKLAEAKAQIQAQLVKCPTYKAITEDNQSEQEKAIEEESGSLNESSSDPHTQIKKASKFDEKDPASSAKSESSRFELVDVEQQEPDTKKAKKGETPKYDLVFATEDPANRQEKSALVQPRATKAVILEKLIPDDGTKEATLQVAPPAGAAEIPVDEKPKVTPMAFGGLISSGATVGSGVTIFGSSTFGTSTTGGSPFFGSSTSIKSLSGQSEIVGGASTESSTGFSGSTFAATSAFLTNMKPPSSNAAPFSFGTSSGPIMLPTPSNPQPSTINPFGAFSGSPFGSGTSHGQPLFGFSSSVKRSSPLEKADNSNNANQPRLEDKIDEEIEGGSEGDV